MALKSTGKVKFIVQNICIFLLCFNIFCFIMMKIYRSGSRDNQNDGFVTIAAFCIIKHVLPIFSSYVCIFVIRKYNIIFKIIIDTYKINRNSHNKYVVNPKYILTKMYMFAVLLFSVVLIVFEVIYNNSNFLYLWCMYVPSLITSLYIAMNIALIDMCAASFRVINENLKLSTQFLSDRINKIQRSSRSKEKNNIGGLSRNFIIYEKMYNTVCVVNNVSGSGIIIYFMVAMTMSLSVIYSHITKDEIRSSRFPYLRSFCREYCCIVFSWGMVLMIHISHYLQKEAAKSGSIVHELQALYPDINEEIILHGLQLLSQKIEITAGDLFTIDFDIVPRIILLIVTYLSVFIQINEYYT